MKLNKNKYVPIGMLFLVLAIVLNRTSNLSDLVVGILYGISIGVLITGIIKNRKEVLFELNLLTIGMVLDIWTEKSNDGVKYSKAAGQAEFDKF